jgi:5-methylcytosine-specific restriction endonuclease McrA
MAASDSPPSLFSISLIIVARAVDRLRENLRDHAQAAESDERAASDERTESDELAMSDEPPRTHQSSFHRARPTAHPDPVGERHRRIIPQDVKIAVSARDGGRCRKCGSSEKLHFDHVIPVSKGGANTVANIQLLCGVCNRAKGAK